jgi:hypothetical protein
MSDPLDQFPNLDSLPSRLPPFTANGSLEPGDFAPRRGEFEGRFVDPPRPTRSAIYAGWQLYRQALLADGLQPASRQLLDGSFTTAKIDPGDIDLAVEVPLRSDQTPPRPEEPIGRLLLGRRMQAKFKCDAYPIYTLPTDHPDYSRVTLAAVRYWTRWFGTDRAGRPKGRVWAETGGLR